MTNPTATQADPVGQLVHLLETQVRGAVHVPGDAGYDEQGSSYRGAPALIVEATCAADVRAAVLGARHAGLDLVVQSTGHGTHDAPDGSLLLRTSAMRTVLVDPDRRVAHVGPGVRWSEVIAAAEPFGLAPLSGDTPSVGVVGYTLGGGLSWLSRAYGFAADSLLRAQLVTADGRMVTADAHHHAELFWALRGGGGNFGVVTDLDIRLHPVPTVFGGVAEFPVERAAGLLRHLERHGDGLPDELSVSIVVGRTSVLVRGVYAGTEAAGRQALAPLLATAGEPLSDTFRAMPYRDVASIGGTPPRGFEMVRYLSDDLITDIVDTVTRPDSQVEAVEIKHWGGAIARPDHPAPGPVSHRDARFVLKLNGPAQACAPITAHATGGSFLNFLGDTTRTHTAYTVENLRRLQAVKATYDPTNVFRRGHVIPQVSPAR